MTTETLKKAIELTSQIREQKAFLELLQKDRLVITISYVENGSRTITTIGVESNSEHGLYEQGRNFIDQLIEITRQEIDGLEREFKELI